MVNNGFILDPYHELLPHYLLCPFSNKDIVINKKLPFSNKIDEYFQCRFDKNKFYYTSNARQGIALALGHYKLNKNDTITILTTSGNSYISSCVTNEIEKICKWSRVIEKGTKLIFVNHEFGLPYSDLSELRKLNYPIIEDCAYSFFSTDETGLIGTVGDFVVYSFPKMFPIQIGGLLVSKKQLNIDSIIDSESKQYIKNILSFYIEQKEDIIEKRFCNYQALRGIFLKLGFNERFNFVTGTVPGVFMFNTKNSNIDLPILKKHFIAHGIQCSVFYGEESFFLPCHQSLELIDIEYFVTVFLNFMINHV